MTYDLYYRRQLAFGEASHLYASRFDRDNGSVPQLQEARTYVNNWNHMDRHGLGLLLWGQPGNGKTFAAACIANALLEQDPMFPVDVRMATFGTILTALLAKSPQEKEIYLQTLSGCGLLILDDFGMERQTDYAREQVFNVVDSRYLTGRPMIVTTNLSLDDLKNPATMAERRIYDRILERCVPVFFSGESLRREKAKENLNLYRKLTRDN